MVVSTEEKKHVGLIRADRQLDPLRSAPMSAFEGKSRDIAASKDPLPRLARSRIDESDQFCSHTAEGSREALNMEISSMTYLYFCEPYFLSKKAQRVRPRCFRGAS